MESLREFFGFTTAASSAWNAVAYAAFVGIITGVFWERYRNLLITLGAAILALYSGIFFHNTLFTVLQLLIVVSGLLQLVNAHKRFAMITMVTFTITAYVFLALSGIITDTWALMGSFGLLGIAFGLVILPKHYGFIVMSMGGILLIFYGFAVEAWVFFFLNIFFAVANMYEWSKVRPIRRAGGVQMGKLLSIAVKERPHGPMTPLVEAKIDSETGIAGDPRGRGGSSGRRQVTVVALEKWQAACQDLGTDSLSLSWTARRANLLVDGIEFSQDSVGKILHIGPEVCLEITGETTPCSRMDEAHMGLQEALTPDWRGGVTCKVKCGGIIRIGMRVWI